MSEEPKEQLSEEELEQANGEALPDREQMSVIKQPWEVAGYELPRGSVVAPNIYLSHYRQATWGDPDNFRPERFIGTQADGSTWLPFGGGIRRCIGASFALYEMRVVIQSIARALDVRAVREQPEPIVRRAITFAPGHDVPIIVSDAERSTPLAAAAEAELVS